jgi:hypothetical protein
MAETGLHQNWNRDYDPFTGKYAESDPIGLAAGWNTYAYVRSNPIGRRDLRGLQEVEIPGYEPPDNAREAAGFLDPEWQRQCTTWHCPSSPNACGINDSRKSTDFTPPAIDPQNPPAGCTCIDTNWFRVDRSLDSNDAIAIANAALDAASKGPSIWQRIISAISGVARR